MKTQIIFPIPAGTKQSKCRGCGKTIYWIKTKKGKRMPVNPDGVCHFATCPKRNSFRKNEMKQMIKYDFKTLDKKHWIPVVASTMQEATKKLEKEKKRRGITEEMDLFAVEKIESHSLVEKEEQPELF